MNKANIMEVFHSVQGEGKYVGVSQVFIRFFECNMHCSWCDTPNSIGDTVRNYKEYSLDELEDEVSRLWQDSHSVSFTGGEPLMQADFIKAYLEICKSKNRMTYLETNGVFPDEYKGIKDDIDIVAMDLKLPSSTKCRPYWEEHRKFLETAKGKDIFVKMVVTSDTDIKDVEESISLIAGVDKNILTFLQPNYFEMKNGVINRCLEFEKVSSEVLTNVRILPQVHKFMKMR